MVESGLRDQDWLEGSSNYVIWKEMMKFLLDEHDLKLFIEGVLVVLLDEDPLKEYKKNMAQAKRSILEGVRDHVMCHNASKSIA